MVHHIFILTVQLIFFIISYYFTGICFILRVYIPYLFYIMSFVFNTKFVSSDPIFEHLLKSIFSHSVQLFQDSQPQLFPWEMNTSQVPLQLTIQVEIIVGKSGKQGAWPNSGRPSTSMVFTVRIVAWNGALSQFNVKCFPGPFLFIALIKSLPRSSPLLVNFGLKF